MIRTSSFWRAHFEKSASIQRIDWGLSPAITPDEKKRILYSLKAFQLGETGDGHNLLRAAGRYAKRFHDPEYLDAVRLFIREEQKHGANLGRYIDRIGEQRASSDWGDTLFRFVRGFNTSMEVWTITVLIIESAAQGFYQALHDATKCPLLRNICRDILIDEAHHVKFQNERLWIIFQRKRFYARALAVTWYCLLFFGTIHAIWFSHRRALRAGGVHRDDFMQQMYHKFFRTIQFVHRSDKPVPMRSLHMA